MANRTVTIRMPDTVNLPSQVIVARCSTLLATLRKSLANVPSTYRGAPR